MLCPQSNPFRQVIDLSGFWELRFDPETEKGVLTRDRRPKLAAHRLCELWAR
jgi:hypothetical protein